MHLRLGSEARHQQVASHVVGREPSQPQGEQQACMKRRSRHVTLSGRNSPKEGILRPLSSVATLLRLVE